LSKAQKAAAKEQEKRRKAEHKRQQREQEERELAEAAERLRQQRESERQEKEQQEAESLSATDTPQPEPAPEGQIGEKHSGQKKRRIGIGSVVGALVLIPLIVYAVNHFGLQSDMNEVLSKPGNYGIDVSVHYGSYLDGSTLVYDLKSVSSYKSMADVFRVFLQYAEKIRDKDFETVKLCFRGDERFQIDGDYFRKLGREYSYENVIYTIRTFPEHLKTPYGSRAFPPRLGGWLYVMGKQMEDFNDFHRQWYLADLMLDADLGMPSAGLTDAEGFPDTPITPEPSVAPQAKSFEIVSIRTRVTQSNEFIWQYAWKLTLRSKTSRPLALDAEIKFLDQDGFLVHRDFSYDIVLPSYEQSEFTGAAVMTPDVGRRVANAEAIVRLR
jgi:hypothetical protein